MQKLILRLSAASLTLTCLAQSMLLYAQEKTIDVNVNTGSDSQSFVVSPLWVVIGLIGLLALIAIIVAVSRGGSSSPTTVIKD